MIEYLSQTMLNQWARCPEQFRRRWIEGEIVPPGIAARVGTGLHKGAEVNHRAKIVTGKDEPLSVVQDAARDGYIKGIQQGVFLSEEEVPSAKKLLSDGVDSTVRLAKLYRQSLAPKVHPVLVEKTVYLVEPSLPVPFRGIIDVVADGGWLLDIKSAHKKWPESRTENDIQATLYGELVRSETGQYPRRISFEIFTKLESEHQSIETTRTPEDYRQLVSRAQLMLASIEAGIFPPATSGADTGIRARTSAHGSKLGKDNTNHEQRNASLRSS